MPPHTPLPSPASYITVTQGWLSICITIHKISLVKKAYKRLYLQTKPKKQQSISSAYSYGQSSVKITTGVVAFCLARIRLFRTIVLSRLLCLRHLILFCFVVFYTHMQSCSKVPNPQKRAKVWLHLVTTLDVSLQSPGANSQSVLCPDTGVTAQHSKTMNSIMHSTARQ